MMKMKPLMIITPLLGIEILAIVAFWIFTLTGSIDGFETVMLFEPEFTIILVFFSIITGMLIRAIIEQNQRFREERK